MKYCFHRRCWKPGLLMTLVLLILAACIKEPVRSRPTRPLWVTADGDVYFSIAPHTVNSYRFYKNDSMLYTSPFHNFSPICVTEPK